MLIKDQNTTEESMKSFLNRHSSKTNDIATEINKKMNDIAQGMSDIQIYLRDSEKQNKEVYKPLMDKVKDYFNYIQNSVQDSPTKNPILKNVFKYQVYKTIFSLNKPKPLELLFCAQTLDADLLLACARRANQCLQGSKKRNLILCDMNMCRDFIELQVLIENAINVGILHHYIPVNLDELLNGSNNSKTFFDEDVRQAVLDVTQLIPIFIKNNLPQTENNLKVVLRSCYGVELNREKSIPALNETKAYPMTIMLLDDEYQALPDQLKGHIVIQQAIIHEQYETKLYLPIHDAGPILLKGFPGLNTAKNFELFAQKLAAFWPELNTNKLHINPYSIHTYPQLSAYRNPLRQKYTQGLKNFKAVFTAMLAEWEEGIGPLKSPKIRYNSLFTTTTNLKDATVMPAGSYAETLLKSIKESPYVAVYKAYYADYRAGPDRTILEMDEKGRNAGSPKALVVSRNTMWGQNKPTNNNSQIMKTTRDLAQLEDQIQMGEASSRTNFI